MIKRLYVNGCSWTAGNEIECSPEFEQFIKEQGWQRTDASDPLNWDLQDAQGKLVSTVDKHYDLFNWAGELKQQLGAEQLINDATGGGSNDRVVRTTVEYVKHLSPARRKNTLVVIGWTIADRSEILIDRHWQRFNPAQQFSQTVDRIVLQDNLLIEQLDQYQQQYVSYVFNDRQRVHNYFQSLYLLSNLLDNLGIPYYFFNALPAWWNAGGDQISFDVLTEFASEINWLESHKNIHSRHDTMFGYVHQNNLPVAPYGHPLAAAHKSWAQHLHNHLLLRNIV